ncbi:hypothetical protein KKC1_31720 [Calderihabitans maritimus]|uniref:Uncharacterized protein n=1 Tax=Calderihabitans maritimus TaxID=1246530 RepID=A0A1Z5HX15_9FIRM|nr:hypothetical protein KKC1_31720 [Calderihabitans maritimus]
MVPLEYPDIKKTARFWRTALAASGFAGESFA